MYRTTFKMAGLTLVLIVFAALVSGLPAVLAQQSAGDSSRTTPSYALVKEAIARLAAQEPNERKRGAFDRHGSYYLDNCQLGSDFVGDQNRAKLSRTGIYADVANEVTIWETDLRALGYPQYVWQPWVAHYEASAVALANRVSPSRFYDAWNKSAPALEGLQTRLERYWRSHPRLKRTSGGAPGCGAGEESFKLATQPRGGQVLIIPSFYYQLCAVQRINPDDASRCIHWREVIDGTVTEVSGDYYYRVHWRDGSVRKGKLNLSSFQGDTLTLRKP